MSASQFGDRVLVHYVQTFEDGSVVSSRRGRKPLELTVGTDPRRLPGLGLALVGMEVGQVTTIDVPAERAYGPSNPARIKRVSRARFVADVTLTPDLRTRMRLRSGRRRLVRVVEAHDLLVVVDLNHPRCGQSVRVEVELLAILEATTGADPWGA